MFFFNIARFRCFGRRKNHRTNDSSTISKTTRSELDRLVHTADPVARKAFDAEMQAFFKLHTRYLKEKENQKELDCDRINSAAENHIIAYDKLPKKNDPKALSKLALLKVNSGLGTSMGMYTLSLFVTVHFDERK